MTKLRVMTVIGTRPEAIKMAPVVQELYRHTDIESIVVATAQHREMLDQVLALFHIQPARDLNLMRADQSLAELTAAIFTNLDPLLTEYRPDWLLAQGDTTTVMAAAVCAYYRQVKFGHVEAGLRTGDKRQPFPEEVNRRMAGVIADLHFAPTDWARDNLLHEGIAPSLIKVTGNTIIDALNQIKSMPMPAEIETLLKEKRILNGERDLVLVTAHRRESFGQPIREICAALKELAEKYANQVEFIYPVHLNPNIQAPVQEILGDVANISLLAPLEYLPLVHLEMHAKLILTDSGGIQEEATGLGKPCLVLRERTERPEGVQAGVLKLVGTSREMIVSSASNLLDDPAEYARMAHAANPYGDGTAAQKIVSEILAAR
ncbi:non-hydrolyzing UDP-N-acetylglucosamine 2-epimerase [Pelolinea submarina]|uniref:UDP-N-acetylglucosamine 2-epimerase (non-hydrolyzing) n=1 Tax=Pelolinea submarina TaxID=913107 RepID=A0A347ZRC3_9CHLR|nr:UDP-N-acetylglucosamine 2-epimerase (non-hydrolyzing) [Pelolinea submarina]REG11590.1 UDP-N-acetylglucosamine 2-epimerase (non-hydrolysing) [Pelolinea submarina]BBB47854.1 UDP-N-acetylglucosamine 2-epimerase (non-hydrolysing) [Pelolinea submarina]